MKKNDGKIAVFIKTCQGRPSLAWTLNSVKFALYNEEYRIYISDEYPIDDWKEKIYDELARNGHHIEIHEAGIKCGVARNLLATKLNDEDYILRMDDDFELGGKFNIEALKSVLSSSIEVGFCSDLERQIGDNKGVKSGSIRPAGGDLIFRNAEIIKQFHSPFKKYSIVDGCKFIYAEFTRNLLLIKRDVIDKVKWDENLLFRGEHLDFMLSVRTKGYKGAYTLNSMHNHRDDLKSFNNRKSNSLKGIYLNDKEYNDVYQRKWGVNKVKTKYPVSWYLIEANRRLIDRLYK